LVSSTQLQLSRIKEVLLPYPGQGFE